MKRQNIFSLFHMIYVTMFNMKNISYIFLFVFWGIALNAKAQVLVLHHANGTTTDIELYTKPQVKFQNDKVLIVSTVLNMEYPKEDVLSFTYKGGTQSVDNTHDYANVSQNNGKLTFRGLKSSDKVAIFTAKGIRVPANLRYEGSTAWLSLSSIPKGVYVLCVNGRTSKFTRQ